MKRKYLLNIRPYYLLSASPQNIIILKAEAGDLISKFSTEQE